MTPIRFAPLVGLFAATSLAAADLIPLRNGIFVPVESRCKGASRAEMVNYWGGRSSIGSGMADCEIRKISHKGNVYTYTDQCTDIASGGTIDGSTPTRLTVLSPISFRMGEGKDSALYKYCGSRPVE